MLRMLIILILLAGLYATTYINYLLFHCLAEISSIVIAISFFLITWNSKKYLKNQYLLFIGIAYLFIAFLDLLHTLSYKGMPIFIDYDFYANQIWIGARYMESITLVSAFYFLEKNRQIRPEVLVSIYTAVTVLLVLSIFYWKIFPVCFVEGSGLTPFKKISEYIICMILISGAWLLYRNKGRFEPNVFKLLFISIICTIISELAFTFYISNYGFSNLIGHYFKLFSFYLIYKSIIETCVQKPYELIFRELDSTIYSLNNEIKRRINAEKDREKVIKDLKNALAEVKTLSGLIPICSHCKKIRDDQGFWNQLEQYIAEHSDATLSHGICPDCIKKHYPDM